MVEQEAADNYTGYGGLSATNLFQNSRFTQNVNRGANASSSNIRGQASRVAYGRGSSVSRRTSPINTLFGTSQRFQNSNASNQIYRSFLGSSTRNMGTADIGASRPGAGGFNQSYLNLQRRIHESMRDVRNINSRHTSRHNTIFNNQNLNMFSNFGNDDGGIIGGIGGMGGLGGLNAGFGSSGGLAAAAGELGMLFFNSPCKIFYSVNDSEWSDGVDINLMNQKRAPLNLVVTMPPEMPKLSKSPQAS